MARAKKKLKAKGKKAVRRPAKKLRAKRVAKRPARRAARASVTRAKASKAVQLPKLPKIEGYVNSLPPPVKVIVNTLRRIVRETAPEAKESLSASGPAYEANGLFARIETKDRAVLLEFLNGNLIEAPEGILEAGPGNERHITLSSVSDVRGHLLRVLVRQAVLYSLERQPQRAQA